VEALVSLGQELRDREDLRQKLKRLKKDSRGPGQDKNREDLRQNLKR
jgi:hypothetical protein